MFDALGPRDVGDMNEAVNAVLNLDERAKIGQVADAAFDSGPDAITILQRLPRVWLDLLNAEADAAVVRINFEHLGLDLLSGREQLRRMLDPLRPCHLGDMNQSLDARLDLDERAVIGDRNHLAFNA